MTAPSKIKLSRLRDIAWLVWDPIGLLIPGQNWNHEDYSTFADEYDKYMVQAASQLRRGVPDTEVIEYLINIEAEHMGLGLSKNTRDRAEQVIAAIHADKEIWIQSDQNCS